MTWQTIQVLLGPHEHVSYLQRAVEIFDVRDPETDQPFPKVLPKSCFPEEPDPEMEKWYQSVADRLQLDEEEPPPPPEEQETGPRIRVEVLNDPVAPRSSAEFSSEGSTDERHGAATYFADPLYRKRRPQFMRHFSKQPVHPEDRRGNVVANRVRHIFHPFGKDRRRSPPEVVDDFSDDGGPTPIAVVPPPHPKDPRYPNHKRPHPPRRESSISTTDSDSDSDRPPRHRNTPTLRRRRSHDPPTSPREYFPAPQYYDASRRFSHDAPAQPPPPLPEWRKEDGPPPVWGPSNTPPFAAQVAHLQAQNYYEPRPAMPPRTSYQPHVQYKVKPVSPRVVENSYPRERDSHRERERDRDAYNRDRERDRERERERERDRERERERERDRDRDRLSTRSHHDRERDRRRSEEHLRERERDRDRHDRTDSARTRSHDEWDDRDRRDRSRDERSRERERDRDRDRDGRVRSRYAHVSGAGTLDGVSGRRYPNPNPLY